MRAQAMTAQLCDQVMFEGVSCDLVCWTGGELFDPRVYGVNPVSYLTSLNRGWLAHYRVERRLSLEELMLEHEVVGANDKLTRHGRAPAINGVEPDLKKEWPCNGHYRELNLPIAFGGGMLIGDGDAIERFGRGSPPAWAYRRLRELVFIDGELIEAIDHSTIAAALRERDALRHDADRVMGYPAAEEWRAAFCYDYGF